jgi:hypothetical protein
LGDGHLGAGGEGTGSCGVDDGGIWACSVSGDDVNCAGDGAAAGNLGQGAARLCHDGGHVGESVWAGLGLSESVGGGGLGVEDGGVDFGLLVGSGTWDDTTLDTETCGVSTSITSLLSTLVWTMNNGMRLRTMTAILPWAATRGDAARARMKSLENMFACGGVV